MKSWPQSLVLFGGLAFLLLGLAGLLAGYDVLTQPIATVIASAIVPLLGFVGYRYQKYMDREADALSARRGAYLELVQVVEDNRRERARGGDAHLWNYHCTAQKILLLADDEIAEAMSMHRLAMVYAGRTSLDDDLWESMNAAEEDSFGRLLDFLRRDLNRSTRFLPSRGTTEARAALKGTQ